MTARIHFAGFELDPADRQLRRNGTPVEVNGRYFDALALLVQEQGRLVTKDRFMDEVWRGVPVTDEALTQCIRTLRRQLGDDAARPRFIETVPKHGYRFIASVEGAGQSPVPQAPGRGRPPLSTIGLAGTLGGGLAGVFGGLFYGFAGAAPGVGALSTLLVMLSLTVLVALVGAAGVAFGITVAGGIGGDRWQWSTLGGGLGGLVVGAIVKLLGLDAFNLLIGRAPGGMTGAQEGALLGAAVGLGYWLARRQPGLSRGAALAALCGGAAGLLVPLLGGRLMGGSLALLANQFPGSRLRLGAVGALFGERGFGQVSEMGTATLEGALFAGCIVAAMLLATLKLAAKS